MGVRWQERSGEVFCVLPSRSRCRRGPPLSVPAATRRAGRRGGAVTRLRAPANIAGDGFATLAARGRARAHLLALLRPLRTLAGPAAPGRRDRVGDLPGRALGDHRDARPGRLGGDRPGIDGRCLDGGAGLGTRRRRRGTDLRAARAGSARSSRRQHGAARGAAAGAAPAGDGERPGRRDRRRRPGRAGGGGRLDLPAAARAARARRRRPARRGRCRC